MSEIGPWRGKDVVVLCAVSAVAAVGLLIAWWGASGSNDPSRQVLWLNVAVGFVLMAGTGNVACLTVGRRAIAERRAHLLPDGLAAYDVRQGTRPEAASEEGDTRVAAPSMTRYHHPRCPLVGGKTVGAAVVAEHVTAGRKPCEVCGA